MIDKSEYFFLANVCRILGADHLNFEGVMNDLRKKKYLANEGEKSLQGSTWEK